jgi:methylenetetrahydrofolate/methylenetetrahydromethanopterin dehydrogenase (NADP+)
MARKILIQLDGDPQPSTFDSVVAVDAGADVLLRHGNVTPDAAVPLVHGAMFTRGGDDLASTAIFVGGSDVAAAEAVFDRVRTTFFGPVRVSVLLDPAGANTTASAAVVAAGRHLPLSDPAAAATLHAVVLGGTVCERIVSAVPGSRLEPVLADGAITAETLSSDTPLATALATADLIVAAGAAGVTLLGKTGQALVGRGLLVRARVFIDLNAVPPAGIEGIAATDKARQEDGAVVYGALGVGGTKMKIHRAAIRRLFESNDAVLDAEELLAIGESL